MGGTTATHTMALDDTLETTSLANANDIHKRDALKFRYGKRITNINFIVAAQPYLTENALRGNAVLLEVSGDRLRKPLFLLIGIAELNRIVTIVIAGLALDNHTGPDFKNCDWDLDAVFTKDLRHS